MFHLKLEFLNKNKNSSGNTQAVVVFKRIHSLLKNTIYTSKRYLSNILCQRQLSSSINIYTPLQYTNKKGESKNYGTHANPERDFNSIN
ncbi:Uncharacterised protein [uncultured archaeon]|nr:Uncharacterised protein [uncultured archaeon]